MKKVSNKKGFTLAELLIVVAIIAVLVAIAIPVFGASLNKAKVAADRANIRAGYAYVAASVLGEDSIAGGTFNLQPDGTAIASATTNYKTQGSTSETTNIAGKSVTGWAAGKSVTYTVTADTGAISITVG